MGIEFARTHIIGRAKGHTAVKAAAYRSGTRLHDARIAENYLNDARMAEYLAEKGVRKGHGSGRIHQTLKQRGLEADLVENAVNSLDADWFEMAQAIRDKMFKEAGPLDQKQKSKLIRKLQYQGHSMDAIREVVEG